MGRLLVTFIRGIARSVIRRTIGRAMRGGLRSLARRATNFSDEIEDVAENLVDAVGIMEMLELAAEIPGIITSARAEAAAGSAEVFESALSQCNPGQQALIQDYALPAAEDYWASTTDPDPDDYVNTVCSAHEAIEQAVGGIVEISWEAGSAAAKDDIWSNIAAIIGEETVARAADILGQRRRRPDFDSDKWYWDLKGNTVEMSGGMRIPKRVLNSEMYRPITDSGHFLNTQMASAPFWLKARGMYQHGLLTGQISFQQSMEGQRHLYRATAGNPDSPNPPSGGYTPLYDINVDGTRWAAIATPGRTIRYGATSDELAEYEAGLRPDLPYTQGGAPAVRNRGESSWGVWGN